MSRRPERPKRGRIRRALVGIASFAIVPAVLFLLEAWHRRGERRPEPPAPRPRRIETPPPVAELPPPPPPAPPVVPEPVAAAPADDPWAALDADLPVAPLAHEPPPIEPEVAAGADEPDDAETPPPGRSSLGRLTLLAIIAAIIVVIPTLLYVALSSSPATKQAKPLPSLKVVAYYPPNAGWAYMWTRFDPARIRRDLVRARSLGFDTVRVFVPPSAFGFPEPSATMQARLRTVIEAADAAHLKVGLSLFDRFEDYDETDASAIWLRDVLGPYASDRRIAFVDVHNEIDPGNGAAVSWYRKMLKVTRQLTGIPVIASVPGRVGVAGLHSLARDLAQAPPDAYSLHYYSDPAYLVTTLHRAQQAVAPTSLILGEVGYSTAADDPATLGAPATVWAQEAQQSLVLRAAFDATRRLALPPPGIWTLFDSRPDGIPPAVAAGQHEQQQAYGILRANGTPKPAAADVRAYLTSSTIATDINADFSHGGNSTSGPQPADWRTFDGAEGTLRWDPAVGHDAPGSVRLSQTKGTAGRVPSYFQPIWSVEIRPHEAYTVSVWARGSGIAGDDRVAVSWFDKNGNYLRQKESTRLPAGNPGWTRLTLSTNPPEGAAVLEVHLKSSNEPGTVWFDDVEIH